MHLTASLERVLRVFLEDIQAHRYGYDLMKASGLKSGTLYPMLARLEQEGVVVSSWEERLEDLAGRPRRRYYRLTGEGVRVARQLLAEAYRAPTRTAARGSLPSPSGEPA